MPQGKYVFMKKNIEWLYQRIGNDLHAGELGATNCK